MKLVLILDLLDVAEIFKETPYIVDLKPGENIWQRIFMKLEVFL